MQLNEATYMKKSAKIKFVLVHKCLSQVKHIQGE